PTCCSNTQPLYTSFRPLASAYERRCRRFPFSCFRYELVSHPFVYFLSFFSSFIIFSRILLAFPRAAATPNPSTRRFDPWHPPTNDPKTVSYSPAAATSSSLIQSCIISPFSRHSSYSLVSSSRSH